MISMKFLNLLSFFEDTKENQISYIIDEGNRIKKYDWNNINRCFKRNDDEILAIIECLYWDNLSSTPIKRKFCISTNLSQVFKYKVGIFFHYTIGDKFFLILDCIIPISAIWMNFKLIKSENLLPILEHSSNVKRLILSNEFLIQDGDSFNVEYYTELDDFLGKLEYQNSKKEIYRYCKEKKSIENSTWLEVKDRFLFKPPLERISIEKINTSVEVFVARPRTKEIVGIIPEKSIFGFDFYSKVIDFTKNFNSGASSSNPFGNLPMLMMMDNKGNNNDILMLMMMNGGAMDFSNPMFMYMMLSKSDDKSNLLPLMILMGQNKNEESTAGYKIDNSKSNIVLNSEDLNWYPVD